MKSKQRLWIALGVFVIMLGINFLGANGYINGLTQKDVSDKYPTLITPEPLAFAIWGAIYISVAIALVWLLKNHKEEWADGAVDVIFYPFVISCALNAAWIVAFSYEQLAIGLVFTLGMAFTLATLCRRLVEKRKAPLLLPAFAFGLYTGWVLIASVLNVAIWLVQRGWDNFGPQANIITLVTLVVALALTVFVAVRLRNTIVPIPVAWAYILVGWRHVDPTGYAGMYPLVYWPAFIGAAFLLFAAVHGFFSNRRSLLPPFPS